MSFQRLFIILGFRICTSFYHSIFVSFPCPLPHSTLFKVLNLSLILESESSVIAITRSIPTSFLFFFRHCISFIYLRLLFISSFVSFLLSPFCFFHSSASSLLSFLSFFRCCVSFILLSLSVFPLYNSFLYLSFCIFLSPSFSLFLLSSIFFHSSVHDFPSYVSPFINLYITLPSATSQLTSFSIFLSFLLIYLLLRAITAIDSPKYCVEPVSLKRLVSICGIVFRHF